MSSTKKRTSNFESDEFNPCLEESKLSMKCLEENNYNYPSCNNYFFNYKICKTFWHNIKLARAKAGIKPHIPNRDERAKILELKKRGINVIEAS